MGRRLLLALLLAVPACAEPPADTPDAGGERTLSGTVTGLVGALTLTNFGVPVAELDHNGPFTLAQTFRAGTPYALHVKVEPTGYGCTVENDRGSFGDDDVLDVRIRCSPDPHSVGGAITGLQGAITLLDNEGDELEIEATTDTTFTFADPVGFSSDYDVTISVQPKGQLCQVEEGAGTVGDEDVTTVLITCRTYDVILSEIHARPITGLRGDANGDGVRDSGDDEFVEILSREDVDVPVGGWVVAAGSATQPVQFEFAEDAILPARGRVVIFGGPTPTGSFGGAQVFVTSGLSLTDSPAATLRVLLEAEHGGLLIHQFEYGAGTFGDSASQVCADETAETPAFVSHITASGQAGILWSPGVASTAAIPKVNPAVAAPVDGAMNVSVLADLRVQFNMFVLAGSLAEVKLFQSTCDTPANDVGTLAFGFLGTDESNWIFVPPPLLFDTSYCLVVPSEVLSAGSTPLVDQVTREFHTRLAASAPATTVVISEIGGCRFSASSSAGCAGATGSDEYIELHNPTDSVADISGWFVQRRTAAGTGSCYATVPATTSIAAHGYYLVVGANYTASRYPGTPAGDLVSGTSSMTGADESIVLLNASGGSCTGQTGAMDSVTYGDAVISDASANLRLPKLPQDIPPGNAIERKACWDSTAGTDDTNGMGGAPGHSLLGNRERIGASNADWVQRTTMGPQNSLSAAETGTCPP